MVSKCANPQCSSTFRYLHEGRLFHVPLRSIGKTETGRPGSAMEYFWLCAECSRSMKLILYASSVITVPLEHSSEHGYTPDDIPEIVSTALS